MKKLLIGFTLLIRVNNVQASHAMGGELSYRSLGNQQFLISFTFYRDCSGIPAPSTVNLNISDSTGTIANILMNPTPASPVQLNTVCPTAITTCNGGTYLGIEKWVYSTVYDVPAEQVILSIRENARSTALTTLASSGDDLFVYAMIDNSSGAMNSSPAFGMDPVIMLCESQSYCIPSFVTDADGDSLSFQFVCPRIGPLTSDTVTYNQNYSASQPFSSSSPVTINAFTGDICISPTASGEVSPVAILISEFRNGSLLGQVERDMQMMITTCSNSLPTLTGFNGVPSFSLNACAGQQNCFFITAIDANANDSTFLTLDIPTTNTLVSHSFGDRDTMFVCWTPTDSDTTGLHCYHATVSDDNCPFPGKTYADYCISVTPSRICNPSAAITEKHPDEIEIYPQPVNDWLHIRLSSTQKTTLILYSMIGNVIDRVQLKESSMDYNTHRLSTGIYLAKFTDKNGDEITSRKIVVLKN